nr:uncharacterized protein LOC127304047 [Lolium perenne]
MQIRGSLLEFWSWPTVLGRSGHQGTGQRSRAEGGRGEARPAGDGGRRQAENRVEGGRVRRAAGDGGSGRVRRAAGDGGKRARPAGGGRRRGAGEAGGRRRSGNRPLGAWPRGESQDVRDLSPRRYLFQGPC